VARNLLVYRYKQLGKAIENAQKLGFRAGAALYPMVTMNGEECHNEWEITFEEIHRNGAIAYAIYDYVRYENNANNNWYTNYIAAWTLRYTIEAVEKVNNAGRAAITSFAEGDELRVMLMGLKRFTKIEPMNLKNARRRIADAMIEENKYIF
jgi:maltose phosphorylase